MGRDGLADTRKWDEAVWKHAEMAAELTGATNWIGRRCNNVVKRNSVLGPGTSKRPSK